MMIERHDGYGNVALGLSILTETADLINDH
jgi:hypothetical protein